MVFNSSLFADYYTSYVDSVWAQYATSSLTVDTQASWGAAEGTTSSGSLTFGDIGCFAKPSSQDIFSGSTGAFAAQSTNTAQLLAIGARLDAAFNRSTLMINSAQPDDEVVSSYYCNAVTNHYARIVHAANLDGKGYAFPYDDVAPDNGVDQSGEVNDPNPSSFVITVGGGNASEKMRMRSKRGLEAAPTVTTHMHSKRHLPWAADYDEKSAQASLISNQDRDLESGQHAKLRAEFDNDEPRSVLSLPPALERLFGPYFTKLQSLPQIERLRPLINVINTFLISFLSLSLRAILSRVFLLLLILVLYLVGILDRSGAAREVGRSGLQGEGLLMNMTTNSLDRWGVS